MQPGDRQVGGRKVVRHVVGRVSEIPSGARKIVTVGNRSIGVFNVAGEYYAIRNTCPHQQAPLCEGRIMGTTLPSRPGVYTLGMEGRVLRCPWHAWEFDITTGKSLFDPRTCRVKSYEVAVETAVETYRAEVEGEVVGGYAEGSRVRQAAARQTC